VGVGVLPYLWGPAAGKAVYDTSTGLSWTLNANLPAVNNFGVVSTVTLTSSIDASVLTVPVVDADGAVHFSAVDPANTDSSSNWIAAMNQRNYAGTNNWVLPRLTNLQDLYKDLSLEAGDPRLEWRGLVGPFWHLQPGFYWACQRDFRTAAQAPCDLALSPGLGPDGNTPMEYSFNFDDGFEGTDLNTKQFYVMVYYPAPP
jgi:hypothetical protein